MVQELQRNHRELLESAYNDGYFKVPRKTSLVELAEQHNYDSQEASEAMRKAIDECLADEFE
jgi:predicted DNA binding protein